MSSRASLPATEQPPPWRTSLRTCPAARTFSAARALMGPLGISRVTDVTRMDRLGMPVFVSVRPRGRILRVHAGKGISADDARVGALMEAIEQAVAELDSWAPADAQGPFGAMVRRWPNGMVPDDLAPNDGARLSGTDVCEAVFCEWLGTEQRIPVPAELVRLPRPANGAASRFAWSTNGLASGNSLEEATLHALLEVLERDALAMNAVADGSELLLPAALPAPVNEWSARWAEEGVHLIVRAVPNDFGLPCFEAFVHEPASLDVNLAEGSGLHMDRDIALLRAVTEAAQSRLSTIHGGRDDITRFYAKYEEANRAQGRAAEMTFVQSIQDATRSTTLDASPSVPVDNPGPALQQLLEQLARAGFPLVLRHRLEAPGLRECGVHVVKVVVPKCEALEHHNRRMGARLRARVLAGA